MALSAVIVDDEQLARDELAYLLRELDIDRLHALRPEYQKLLEN